MNMTLLHLIILSLVQGVTEFLPVSSSAHLILTPVFLGQADQGVLIDVAAHVGTLLAVMLYFRADVGRLFTGFFDILFRRKTQSARLFLLIILGTLPAVIVGAAVMMMIGENFRYILVIAGANLIFAGLLGWADKKGRSDHTIETLTLKHAFWIGAAQIFAFIPGTSRSGVTMTVGRFIGMKRTESARFSMLLAIPLIGAAGLYAALDLASMPTNEQLIQAAWVAVISFVAALASIHFLLKLLTKVSFMPFVWYRVVLGLFLILYVFMGL